MVTITFRCGHTVRVDPAARRPVCHCGELVRRSVTAPAPRFTGTAARGPLVVARMVTPLTEQEFSS